MLAFDSFRTYSEICCSPQATVTGKLQDKQKIQCGKSSYCWAFFVENQKFKIPSTIDLDLQTSTCYRITFYPDVMDANPMLEEKTPRVARIQQKLGRACKGI